MASLWGLPTGSSHRANLYHQPRSPYSASDMLRVGIVGLPNVGKSTLFNALTRQHAPAANFPFTTVDPNIGVVTVPDERLAALAAMSRSVKVVPTIVEFVDIAGLVQGAHRGEGLGNQFLAHIREVDALAHVVRFFLDSNVIHVAGAPDPLRDVEVVNTELGLADLQTVERLHARAVRDPTSPRLRGAGAKGGDHEQESRARALGKWRDALNAGRPAREVGMSPAEQDAVRDLRLITSKPILYVANLDEQQIHTPTHHVEEFSTRFSPVVPLSVRIEQELLELDSVARHAFLTEYGLTHSGLDDLIRSAYDLLGLRTFFTTGEKETRAWTIRRAARAPEAAGTIHSDFERGFIRAETIATEDLLAVGSYAAAREHGLLRVEGKDYVVREGDVFIFKTTT